MNPKTPDDYPPFQDEPYGQTDFQKAAKRAQEDLDYEEWVMSQYKYDDLHPQEEFWIEDED